MNKITLVDYGLGNIYSAQKALEKCGAAVQLSSDPREILNAEKLVLPGVGAFGKGMEALRERGLVEPIQEYARLKKPLLGICLGMQMLFDVGVEFGSCTGLGLIPGTVELIRGKELDGTKLRVPHVGWNELLPGPLVYPKSALADAPWSRTLFDGLTQSDAFVYFVHSYVAIPRSPSHILAQFIYGDQKLVAAVQSGSIWGCQFHPERSGEVGLNIIRNFVDYPGLGRPFSPHSSADLPGS